MKAIYLPAALLVLVLPLLGHAQMPGNNTKGDIGLRATRCPLSGAPGLAGV